MILGNIKTTNVLIHQYHNLPIQDNNVIVRNDPNDVFRKAIINAYLVGVSNPKGYVYSQPQSHFCMKQYKNLSCFSFCLFIFIFFFILARAMSESALKRLWWEAREKEVEMKAEAFRKKKIEKEIAKQFN